MCNASLEYCEGYTPSCKQCGIEIYVHVTVHRNKFLYNKTN